MSELLSQICLSRGIKINPAKADPAVAKDVQLLTDVRALFEQLALMEGMKGEVSALSFSDEALTIYSGASSAVSDPDPFTKSVKTIEATIRTIDGIKNKKKREKLSGDRTGFAKMLEIVRGTEKRFNAIKKSISAPSQETLRQLYTAEQQSSTTIKLINALKSTILNTSIKLSAKTKAELKIGGEGWVERLSSGQIDQLFNATCKAAKAEVEASQPVIQPPVIIPAKPSSIRYGVRGGAGYGTGDDQRLMLQGGGSLRYKRVQVDYNGTLNTDRSVKQGTDDASTTLKLDRLQIQAGWFRFKDSVTGTAPDMNGVYLRSRLALPIGPTILTADEELFSGYVADKWQTSARLEPGLTLNLGSFKPFAGGTVGYDTAGNRVIYGGFIGAGLEIGQRQEGNLRADYDSLRGVTTQVRYFINFPKWGVGPTVLYNYNLEDKKHTFSGGLMGRIQLWKFSFLPYVIGSQKDVNFGLVVRFGELQLPRPSSLKPYSLDPLPEGK